jgi:hypothetical protein
MNVSGNNTPIADGDSSPAAEDGTNFGQSSIGGGAVERTFTVANAGTAPLNLSSSPIVAITGPAAGDFTVVAQPVTPVAPGGQTSFKIRFAPAAAGPRDALISIENDSDETPYDFAVTGVGTSAAAQLRFVEIKPDLATRSITLRWEGDGAQFQVEKAANVSGPYQPLGAPQSERVFTDANAIQPDGRAFYRVRAL